MRTKTIPEILKECEQLSSKERTSFLKKNDSATLRQILYTAFHPNVEIILPNVRPEYKKNPGPIGVCESHLYRESKKLKYFIKQFSYPGTKIYKLENTFIEILESLHETESELLLQICIDRKLKTKLKYDEIQKAFPEMLPVIEKPKKVKKSSKS